MIMTALDYFCGEELPANVWREKYALRDKQEQLIESNPDEMHWRMANEFARIESKKFAKPYTAEFIYNLFKDFTHLIPQGSPMYAIGNPQYCSTSNCFVCTPPVDSYGGIMQTDQELVQLSKRRGGVGTDISHIRPSELPTTNSARTATGIVPFMERFSNSIREVGQNGRRGALMLTISVHHPQVLDFARVKLDSTKVTGANVSIRFSDEFLQAVKDNTEYEQRWPVDSDTPVIRKKVNAREVWMEIVKCAHARAEPGILFWDRAITESPADCYEMFKSVSTNPCCLSKRTVVYVVTKDGIKEIQQVTKQDEVWVDDIQQWKKTSGYFDAGKAEVFEVKLSNGTELTITANHKLLKAEGKRNGTKVTFTKHSLVELRDLKVGDKIAVHHHVPENIQFGSFGDKNDGYLLGWLVGDGCMSFHHDEDAYPVAYWDFWTDDFTAQPIITKALEAKGYDLKVYEIREYNKKRIKSTTYIRDFTILTESNPWLLKSDTLIHPLVFKGSKEFISGYLAAYFSADGTIQCEDISKSYSIQLASINRNRLEQVRNLLLMFGIKSSIGLMKAAGESIFTGGKKYKTKDCFRLTITGINNLRLFKENIGFIIERKQEKLDKIYCLELNRTAKELGYATIRSIESKGIHEVGCIEVEDAHRFTANGAISGNSEIVLSVLDSCRLLVVNFFSCVVNPYTKNATIDYDKLYEMCYIGQRLMDDLVDLEIECVDRIINKIHSDPEDEEIKRPELQMWIKIRSAAENGRRTGLGPTAIGDTLAAVGIKYGSNESIETVEKLYRTMKLAAYRSSVDMAEELGPFPVWDKKKEKDNQFLLRIKDEDPILYKDMQKYGRRNIALLTTAPTGSVSLQAGPRPYFGTTSGIEPLFRDTPYKRRKKINHAEKGTKVDYVDALGDRWTEFQVFHPKIKMWMNITGETDWKKSPYHDCCAEDIDWKQRVKLQAAAQRHVDHAISSTLNLPNNVTVDKVAEIYETAWQAGCKGITVYRDGCRDGVLISNDSKKEEKLIKTVAPKRPKTLPCDIHSTTVKGEPYTVIVGKFNDDPYEVFAIFGSLELKVHTGELVKEARGNYKLKAADQSFVVTEMLTDEQAALTRILSTALRHGADVQFVLHQLEKAKGTLVSFSKAIARVLKKYVKDGTEVKGEQCEKCQSSQIIRQEGCLLCQNCGASKCN